MSKKRGFFKSDDELVTDEGQQPVAEIHCPSCHTLFSKDDAPWLKQALHCAKHDRVRLAGTECEFCVAESNEEKFATAEADIE